MSNRNPIRTVMSSREFNQNTAAAKRLAREGPVFVTERGRTSHVLLSAAQYEAISGDAAGPPSPRRSLLDALADDCPGADFDWDLPAMGSLARHTNFSE